MSNAFNLSLLANNVNSSGLLNGGAVNGPVAEASTANAIDNAGGWSVTPSGVFLNFSYNGANVGRLDSGGNFTVVGNITAYGTL